VNVGTLLFIPYRAMETEVMRALGEAGHGVVTLAQARVLQRIGPGGSRLTDLADQAQVTKQTAGVLVDQLQAAGYVRRVPDPTDGRARLVVFTALGERDRRRRRGAVGRAPRTGGDGRVALGPGEPAGDHGPLRLSNGPRGSIDCTAGRQ
jgi:DNA-binding MarR family transcriptional regulator